MAVVWSLNGTGRDFVAFGIRLKGVNRQTHNLGKRFADFILGHDVFASELQDSRQIIGWTFGEVLDGNILMECQSTVSL